MRRLVCWFGLASVAWRNRQQMNNTVPVLTRLHRPIKLIEATFLIEFPDLDKDDWPTVTFTGERFRAAFANLTQYHRVTLNLAEGAKVEKGRGK